MKSVIFNHKAQANIWENSKRFNVTCCGRRFGKTTFAREKLCFASKRPKGLYWYKAPTRGHAKDLMWDELKNRFRQLGWAYDKDETALAIIRKKTRCKIVLKSAEKYDRLRGAGLWGAIFDEFADIDLKAWTEAVRPALSDKLGWCDFLGTPKGMNHFYEMFNSAKTRDNWNSFKFTTLDSPFFQTEEGKLELEEARLDLDERTFRQEYEASFETFAGRICYAFDREKHHSELDYDKGLPIYVGMDFNRNPMTATVSQNIAGKKIFVGEFKIPTSSTEELCKIIKEKYPIAIQAGIIVRPDATGKRRTSNASRSDHEIIKDNGFVINVNQSNPSRMDRYQSCNRALERDQVLINSYRCPKLVKELESLSYKDGTTMPDLGGKDGDQKGHIYDCFGYDIYQDFPIIKTRRARVTHYA